MTAGFTITCEVDRTDYGISVAAGVIGNKVGIRIEALAVAPAQ